MILSALAAPHCLAQFTVFKCWSKNANTAARIMGVLNSGPPCPAPAIS